MKPPALIAGALFLLSCSGEAQPKAHRTVVLELFTSQGCSSCPQADRLLSKLRQENFDGTIIPLAYHVDYWNYIGWTDPFSSPKWSQRQREYARAFKSAQVYTPQLVINGRAQLVGSAEAFVRAEIGRQLKRSDRGAVIIDRVERSADAWTVHVRTQNAQDASLVITLFENGITTAVSRGENADKRLVNDAIVRWQGVANGPTVTIPIDKTWRPQNLGLAAFLQDPRTLEIQAGLLWINERQTP
jgi:hypothetical protein